MAFYSKRHYERFANRLTAAPPTAEHIRLANAANSGGGIKGYER